MILTGRANAARKSKPTQPGPRLEGSRAGLPPWTTPRYPIDTPSKRHPRVIFRTCFTISRGVSFGPDLNSTWVLRPLARHLTCEPPTSSTRILRRFRKLLLLVVPAELLSHGGEQPVGVARFAPRFEA